jgi:hypothetical protein
MEREIRGLFMTLCIAAAVRTKDGKGNKIITASDFMLSHDSNSVESPATKIVRIGKRKVWVVMFSGDPSAFLQVVTDASPRLKDTDENADAVVSAFESAFRENIKRKIEGEILSRYGMTRDQFIENGLNCFGQEEFLRILNDVQSATLGTVFLLAGFDGSQPCIVSVSDPGTAYFHDLTSFQAIGSGAPLAQAALMSTCDPFAPLTDVIYRVSEAKFIGERAPGVGQKTLITVLGMDGQWHGILPPGMEKVSHLWKKKGIPHVPREASKLIGEGLKPLP